MKINISKISFEKLTKKELQVFHNLNNENYGEKIAHKVSEKLKQSVNESDGLYFSHRDYCGIGIFFQKGSFILSTVYDGHGIDKVIAEFNSDTEFINWLSKENDQSMSLYGEKFNNQTITKLRLNWFLEDNYSPVWNDYCEYIRATE
ncbi:hypothetical protein J8L85_00230 [Maribacter sp. MMG018]|uniref:hypothetical protein n=1 Tax=Maribacter sp. MMG018 TaxID=2822688 RepID=UPI001B361472|nr:hypothetical protein [Maribacter sp. MMG018]MBQ4912841.1 hypothetical protein [Maribacter sp. MMG018]